MSTIGTMVLHLRIAESKFTHNLIICDQLPEMELIFAIDIQRKFVLSYTWDKEKKCYIQIEGKFLTYTKNCEQKATIGTVKSTLKIPPQHNGVVPIKISGPIIKEQLAYFITDDKTTKGRHPNINIINGIYKIKGKNLSIYLFPITPTNISPSTKESMLDILNPPLLMMPKQIKQRYTKQTA